MAMAGLAGMLCMSSYRGTCLCDSLSLTEPALHLYKFMQLLFLKQQEPSQYNSLKSLAAGPTRHDILFRRNSSFVPSLAALPD